MCSRNCYRVFGYFLGFLWMVSAVYYTAETIELLKLMKLQCGEDQPEPLEVARLQFDNELIRKACDFYGHLDVFLPYHVITTAIKMTPGVLLVLGIYKNNRTLVLVFAVYGLLEECFFLVVFAKIFAIIGVGGKTIWIYWIIVIFCLKLVFSIWILLGVYAAAQPAVAGTSRPRAHA